MKTNCKTFSEQFLFEFEKSNLVARPSRKLIPLVHFVVIGQVFSTLVQKRLNVLLISWPSINTHLPQKANKYLTVYCGRFWMRKCLDILKRLMFVSKLENHGIIPIHATNPFMIYYSSLILIYIALSKTSLM